jgi:hypothetical protein
MKYYEISALNVTDVVLPRYGGDKYKVGLSQEYKNLWVEY